VEASHNNATSQSPTCAHPLITTSQSSSCKRETTDSCI